MNVFKYACKNIYMYVSKYVCIKLHIHVCVCAKYNLYGTFKESSE